MPRLVRATLLATLLFTASWAISSPNVPQPPAGHPAIPAMADSAKPAAPDSAKKAPILEGDVLSPDSAVFIIETRHRMYPEFKQVDTVRFGQKFGLGEEEITAEPILFNPHVAIYTDGSAVQDSDTLYNPGVRIRVIEADSTLQESWAFHFVDAPHFRRNAFFAFKLVDFKFLGTKYIPAPLKDGQGK